MTAQGWLADGVMATIALGFTLSILPILLSFRHSRRKLELNHAVRMKALELGRPVPGDEEREHEPWTMAARLTMAIGFMVPLGSLGCALIASLALGFHQVIWIMAGMVGLGGVLCGCALAGQTFGSNERSPEGTNHKPYVEEDAYDVVGARG